LCTEMSSTSRTSFNQKIAFLTLGKFRTFPTLPFRVFQTLFRPIFFKDRKKWPIIYMKQGGKKLQKLIKMVLLSLKKSLEGCYLFLKSLGMA
jgi:hypothetical protein